MLSFFIHLMNYSQHFGIINSCFGLHNFSFFVLITFLQHIMLWKNVMYAFFWVIKNVIYAFFRLKSGKSAKVSYLKCHICILKYSKYVPFSNNLAVNSIIAKMTCAWFGLIKKLCKLKYVNHNQNFERWKRNASHEYIVMVYDLFFNVTNVSIT